MEWTIERVTRKLEEIKAKGFIPIQSGAFRRDDGVVGQVLEREFGIRENNLNLRDLGTFELKGVRAGTQLITLSHKRPEEGLSPIQIFDRFGYIRPSRRDPSIIKKKLFITVSGRRVNSVGLRLRGIGDTTLDMVHGSEDICKWDLTGPLEKIDQIILVLAKTQGGRNMADEEFHYIKAYVLNGLKNLKELVDTDVVVIDFCIDQPLDASGKPIKAPHDRGPHIRVPMRKLWSAYEEVRQIL
jgi:hypothetical protein